MDTNTEEHIEIWIKRITTAFLQDLQTVLSFLPEIIA